MLDITRNPRAGDAGALSKESTTTATSTPSNPKSKGPPTLFERLNATLGRRDIAIAAENGADLKSEAMIYLVRAPLIDRLGELVEDEAADFYDERFDGGVEILP